MSQSVAPETGTAAGRTVEALLLLDLIPALQEAQGARAETLRLVDFLRIAAVPGYDPERLTAHARVLLLDLSIID